MLVHAIRGQQPNFEAAQVNILATSDNHGNVHSLPLLSQTIENNRKELK